MDGCDGNCGSCGQCGGCQGCAGTLALTQEEMTMLRRLGEIPFLPVARQMGDATPVYLEERNLGKEEYSLILQLLERKGLISLDFDQPLKGFDDGAYAAYPIRGSMALTQRGQQVVEMLEIQGFDGEI